MPNPSIFDQINEPMSEEITMFETLDICSQYKFGVLYVTPGQTDENDMFCNRKYQGKFHFRRDPLIKWGRRGEPGVFKFPDLIGCKG